MEKFSDRFHLWIATNMEEKEIVVVMTNIKWVITIITQVIKEVISTN